jgi:hypothetical protein
LREAESKQRENREKIDALKSKLDYMVTSFEDQLMQTLNTLKASKDEESLQTLADYQRRQLDNNH